LKLKSVLPKILVGLLLVIVMFFYLFPVYWMVATSFKSMAELYDYPPTMLPARPTIEPYTNVLIEKGYVQLIRNSLVVNVLTIILTLILALLINYPIVRMRIPTRVGRGVLNGVLSIRFLPGIVMIIPFFAIIREIGLYDSVFSLVLIYTVYSLPLAVYMLNGFLKEVPVELEEAALVDGASRFYSFLFITLPLLAPAILAITVITFALSWNEFLFALILTATPRSQTFSIGVWRLVSQFQILWNEMAAVGVIASLIPIVLIILARRYVISALTFGMVREKQ
jgi:multiple sugar transport system permease protein